MLTLTHVFDVALVAYLLALILGSVNLFAPRRLLRSLATAGLTLGVVALTVYIGWRWLEANRAPFSNMFESLVLFAWTLSLVYVVLLLRGKIPSALTPTTALLALLMLVYASAFLSSEIQPLMPALRSNWLTFHVTTVLIGYGSFAVAFLAATGYLIVSRAASQAGPESRELCEAIMSKTISFGFLFLVVGIAMGAVWANVAWGTYWSWDPKETWSLITALIYAVFLHGRYLRNWSGRRMAWIAVIGFISVLITYVGVNYLMKGLHSYAS
ncbi:MAG: c-type cytochrome biogenesis protein CcsB [Verrucomicrobia bacterium]|nr:MAG: c-type cytochrome biogenesis protein CcsB [Verrucomicrobiota bacterium]